MATNNTKNPKKIEQNHAEAPRAPLKSTMTNQQCLQFFFSDILRLDLLQLELNATSDFCLKIR
jgi:hypothetical protein